MERITEKITLYDLDDVKNAFYFTKEGRENAIRKATEYNKKVIVGEINHDCKYLSYVFSIMLPFIFNEKYNSKDVWYLLRHKFVTNKYTMTIQSFDYLKRSQIIDNNICKEIESALQYVVFRFDKQYDKTEYEDAGPYLMLGSKWISNYLKEKGENLC